MKFPLITLLYQLDLPPVSIERFSKDLKFSKIRMLTEHISALEKDTLYIGETLPCSIDEYEKGAALLLASQNQLQDLPEDEIPCCFASVSWGKGAPDLFNCAIGIFEKFIQWEEEIRSCIYEKKGLQALLQLYSRIIGTPAYLVDANFKVLAIDKSPIISEISAIWKHLVNYGYMPYHIVYDLKKSRELEQMENQESAVIFHSEFFNNPFINYNLRDKGKTLGHLFIVGYFKQLTPGDAAYVNYLGTFLKNALMGDIDYNASRGKGYENFLVHMLDGTLKDKDQIASQLRPLGWNLTDSYCVLKLYPKDGDELLKGVLCSKLENLLGGKPVFYRGSIVSIFPMSGIDALQLKEELERFVRENDAVGGLSDEFDGFQRVGGYYLQASVAIQYGGLSKRKTLFCYREFVLPHLFQISSKDVDLNTFCDKAVFRLRDYDRINNSQYMKTLICYIERERSIADTAECLFIHRNTLIYRLKKINEMTKLDLDDYNTRLRLMISFSLLDYMDR